MSPRSRLVILFILNFIYLTVSEPFALSVIHINDFHGRFDETTDSAGICKIGEKCIGGFSRLYKEITTILKDKPDTFVLNAGDDFAGTLWYKVGKWNITQEFMNKIKFDASALGNHEFEDGVDDLVLYLKSLNHPVLVANMDASAQANMQGLYKKSIVIERNGKKIGIIGVTVSSMPQIALTGNLTFSSELHAINQEADRLVKEGVFTNIVLSHCGYEIDKELAKNVSEKISLIVGGHSHTFLYTGDNPPGPEEVGGPYPTVVSSQYGHKVLIVQASSYSRYLGNITVYLNDKGEVTDWSGAPIFLDTTFPQDETINQDLKPWRERVNAVPNPVIGSTLVSLNKWKCIKEECTMGNFVTDAMVYGYSNLDSESAWTEAAIAIADTEGLRTNLDRGEITEDDLNTALPYENTFDMGQIEGSKLKELFEYNTIFDRDGEIHLRLLQVSGIKLIYNLTRPHGDRIQSLKLRCQNCTIPLYEEFHPDSTYNIVVNSYVANGGGNLTVLLENMKNRKIGPSSTKILLEFLTSRNPIFEELDTRIVIIQKKSDKSSSNILKQNIGFCAVILITFRLFF